MFSIKKLRNNDLSISRAFSLKLATVVVIGLIFVVFSIFIIKEQIYNDYVARMLHSQADDVCNQLIKLTNLDSLQNAKIVTYMWEKYNKKSDNKKWWTLANLFGINELDVISQNGIITQSSVPSRVGRSIFADKEIAKFSFLLRSGNAYDGYIESLNNAIHTNKGSCRYIAVKLSRGGMLRLGTDIETIVKLADAHAARYLNDYHIGRDGFVLVLTPKNQILNIPQAILEHIDANDLQNNFNLNADGIASAKMKGKDYLYVTSNLYGYSVLALLPKEEANVATDIFIYSFVIVICLVFFVLYWETNKLIDNTILKNIYNINSALSKIANGQLDTSIDIKDSPEFRELSNGINNTVAALKRNMEEKQTASKLELEIAKNIQFSSLPRETEIFENSDYYEIYGQMDTAKEVGGDFYDYYNVGDGKIVFLVADVSGKGVYAAMFMMRAKTLLKAIAANNYDDPAEILHQANEILCEENDIDMFLTCWLGVLDQKNSRITYANAGHNFPIIVKNGTAQFLSVKPNFLLAGLKNVKYENHTVDLEPGDKILLYTDGVNEAQNHESQFFGNERFLSTVARTISCSASDLCRFVRTKVREFVAGAEQTDDVTLLCLLARSKYVFEYEPKIEVIPSVIDYLEEKLSSLAVSKKIISHISIVADEICANIAQYSGADKASVEIYKKDNSLVVYFKSNGVQFNPLENNDPDITLTADERDLGGLGILIVKKLVDNVSYENKDGQNILRIEAKLN